MANIAKDLPRVVDEKITSFVIGYFGGMDYGENEDAPSLPPNVRGEVLDWETNKHLIDYEYCDGFGGTDCHAVFAWTANWVISIGEYDGATYYFKIPRNPDGVLPGMPGLNWDRHAVESEPTAPEQGQYPGVHIKEISGKPPQS